MLGTLPAYAFISVLSGNLAYIMTASVVIPVCILAIGLSRQQEEEAPGCQLVDQNMLAGRLQTGLSSPSRTHSVACVVLEVDDYRAISTDLGSSGSVELQHQVIERMTSFLRADDMVCQMTDHRFAIAFPYLRQPELGAVLSVIQRLQNAMNDPFTVSGKNVDVSLSAGFCLEGQAPARTGKALLTSARAALEDAARQAPAGVRGYSAATPKSVTQVQEPLLEFLSALEREEITAWFQPQVSTDTGQVTGFEVLARWAHPERGIVPPDEFVPALEETGRLEQLSELMLNHALKALKAWDRAGLDVPKISVNLAHQELRNPGLVDRMKWELDRFDLQPSRVTLEILETVFADSDDDIVARNIRALSEIGYGIDLDDFGTGHSSLSHIRRFHVDRIKIDRSFVSCVDDDPEQQKMVAGVIALAEQLGIETLAEGVETLGEKSILAQLGCNNLQGYSVAHPMPFEQTLTWLEDHGAKLRLTPKVTKRAS